MGSLATTYSPKLLTIFDSHDYIYRELKNSGIRKEIIKREEECRSSVVLLSFCDSSLWAELKRRLL